MSRKAFVGFSKSSNIFGRLIALFQKGRYSHAFFAFELFDGWVVVDSTVKGGVKVHSIESFAKNNRMVMCYEIESDAVKNHQIFRYVSEMSYHKYPMIEIVGNAIQIFFKFFGINIKNIFGKGEKYPRCHELVAMILRDHFGLSISRNLDNTDLVWLEEKLQLWQK